MLLTCYSIVYSADGCTCKNFTSGSNTTVLLVMPPLIVNATCYLEYNNGAALSCRRIFQCE